MVPLPLASAETCQRKNPAGSSQRGESGLEEAVPKKHYEPAGSLLATLLNVELAFVPMA